MGVSYQPIFGIGLEFDEQEDVRNFLSENGFENTEEDEDYYGFCESFTELPEIFDIQCLNYYNGYGYVVYIPLSVRDVEALPNKINGSIEVWRKHFKQEPEIIHCVVVS